MAHSIERFRHYRQGRRIPYKTGSNSTWFRRTFWSWVWAITAKTIFAIIGEEFGFLGTALVIIAFSYLIYRGFEIAKNAKTQRGRLLASGITSWIGLQFFVNIGAMTQLLPLTGVPIPLISYGGSSMVFSLMGLGILANIGKDNSK